MSEPTFEPEYSIAEAKTQLTRVVREAERGKVVQLTRRGEAVAVVLSQAEYRKLRLAAGKEKKMGVWDAIQQWRAEYGGVEWPELDEIVRTREMPRDRNPFDE